MLPITGALELQREAVQQATSALVRGRVAPEQLLRMDDVAVGETESEVVYRENKLELHRYTPEADAEPQDVPILIVYALINRPYILDLQPNRSVVRALLARGFDVYLIDWGEPSALDVSLSLEDYVVRYTNNCVDEVRKRSGLEAINLLGYCMGGTISVMYAALYPKKVRNLGLMAAGLCFDDTGGVLELWGDSEYFSPNDLVETYGNVPADFLDVGFALMDPVHNLVSKYARLYDNLDDDDFVENFARMEHWLEDGIDVAGTTYREFLEEVYQANALYRNELALGGQDVDLANVDMPLLQIVGDYDHLIPPESSIPLNDVVASEDTEVKRMNTGHIGLSVSTRSHAELWPRVSDWFAERSSVARPVEQLQEIPGIGETYAARLVDAGIDSVESLAKQPVEEVATALEVPESRAAPWIDEASKRSETP